VSYLLQRMESYSGMAILSTNLKSHIDTAFMRRLRFVIDMPFPDSAARKSIWEKAFPTTMPRMEIDYDALARLDIAGGNIVVIAINAAFLAAAEEKPVSMAHIAQAAKSEFRKIDREFRMTWKGWEQNG
jgi:SpoVK/Ycf46/Vps4 family AAA+-type ATPase